MSDATPDGLLLSNDLLFTSRIQAAAERHGRSLRRAGSAAEALAAAAREPFRCAILDLDCAGTELGSLIAALKRSAPPAFVVAYGPHVQAALLHAAREAGCDLVLPRSKFVEALPEALPAWFGRAEDPS
jgi:DNA-binding NarL/FixJ family response regulator